jgi:hypothetical protein
MKNNKPSFREDKEVALHFIKTFSDTAREPFLILDPELRVIGANKSFYKNFKTTKKETEKRLVYDLGNGQWNLPELKKALEKILPEKGVFNDFEVAREFPKVGLKVMLLNGRQLDETKQILLAIEDITLKKAIENKLAHYTKSLEKGIAAKTEDLKARIEELTSLNKLMIGRELKMVELKEEIVALKKMKNV